MPGATVWGLRKMSDNQHKPENGKNDSNEDTKLGTKTLFVWLAIVLAIVALLTFKKPGQPQAKSSATRSSSKKWMLTWSAAQR